MMCSPWWMRIGLVGFSDGCGARLSAVVFCLWDGSSWLRSIGDVVMKEGYEGRKFRGVGGGI